MKRIVKLMIMILIILMSLICMNHYVKAASTSFWAENKEAKVGDTITVTAEVTAAQWNLEIKVNGEKIASSYELNNYKENITRTFSGTYKATQNGTVTFSLEGDITDYDQTNSNVNKSVSVTVKEKETEPEPSFESAEQTVYATADSVNVRSSYSTNSSIVGSLKKGESVKRTGVGSNGWSKVSYNGYIAYINSDYLTTTKPATTVENEKDKDKDKEKEEKSKSNNLKTLDVVPSGLTPRFDPNETEYRLTVGSNIAALTINAVADDEKAKVEIKGNKDLTLGENIITIVVTAEDGTKKEYTINVLKEEVIQLGLKELLIEGLPLTPEFSEEVYEYTLSLDNSDISELNITATASRESANVEIIGNADLKPGENVITILVTDGEEESQEIVTYQVTVNLPELPEENLILGKFTQAEFYKYLAIGVVALIVLIILIIIIVKIRKKKREEDNEYDNKYNEADMNNNEIEELSEEELPPSLRKHQIEKEEEKEKEGEEEREKEKIEKEEKNQEAEEISSKPLSKEEERKNKLDEFTSAVDEENEVLRSSRRKKGKHF